ncbi:MAG: ribosome recycling factor, partial [Clostridia bacterium]|nr:ribosome recycling factor [Clostridia bacterium]
MIEDVLKDAEERMKHSLDAFRRELAGIRAGRATPALLEKVRVDYYGTPTPINQMATINIPEPRLIVIQPWDKS